MQHIQDYTSDSESQSDNENDDNLQPDLPKPPTLNLYSLNYSNNMLKQVSLFMYLPWKVPRTVQLKIKKTTAKALAHPSLSGYQWKDAHEHYEMGHHITLYPNIGGEPYKVDQFLKNVKSAVEKLDLSSSPLMGPDQDQLKRNKKLQSILGNISVPSENYMNLKFSPGLSFHRGTTSDSLFLVGKIEYDDYSKAFLSELHNIISTNVKSSGLYVRGNAQLENHVTFEIGEPIGSDKRLALQKLNDFAAKIDTSDLFKDLTVNINRINLSKIDSITKEEESIHFRI